MRNTPHTITVRNSPANSDQTISESSSIPQTWLSDDNWQDVKTRPLSFASQQTNTANDLTNVSRTRNPEYRHPYLENLMQDQRSNLSLQDEILMHRSFALRGPSLERILDREFETLDLEVRKSQVRFLQTFLTSPTAGTITAIYKDVGESVQPGEPVLRVENAARVLLTGVVQHRGLVTLKQPVVLATRNPYETGSSLSPEITYEGQVVAVRGHDADDDEWDLVIECDNSRYHLPINYHFDRDTTRIEFR
jgi:biotin carboxyl carrier protein